ncbi:MAG: protein kinase [Chitinivibrionales bacterium]|nr:protein kinase [Chitinivibrionales bacterium]
MGEPEKIVPITPENYTNSQSLTVLPDGSQPVALASGVISSILGEGGAAIVYDIWVEKLGVHRAVKLLKPNNSRETISRFETEMKVTAQLRHPHIIEIHSVGMWNNLPFIEMEKIEGVSLEKIVEQRGALPLEVCTGIGIMLLRALKFTHNHTYVFGEESYKGILHRDLKPANVMVPGNGVVKIMDFGIATPTSVSMHTLQGTIVGSLQYLAPEQLDGKKLDARSDIYSFGCVIYEMLTGAGAFPEVNVTKLVPARMKNEFEPLKNFRRKLPGKLINLVNKCLAYDADKRYEFATEVLEDLEKIHGKITVLNPEETVEFFIQNDEFKRIVDYRRRFPWKVAFVVIAGAGLIAGATWLITNSLEIRTKTPARLSGAPVEISRQSEPQQTASQAADTAFRENAAESLPEAQKPAKHETVKTSRQPPQPRRGKPVRKKPPVQSFRPPKKSESRTTRPLEIADTPASVSGRVAPQMTLSDSVKQQYGVGTLSEAIMRAANNRHYPNVVRIHSEMVPAESNRPRHLLYKMQALKSLGKSTQLGGFFSQHIIHDVSYYHAKGMYLYGQGKYNSALTQFGKCATAPSLFGNKAALSQSAEYYSALCLTGLYTRNPEKAAKQKALDAWYNVKYTYRNNQGHAHFAAANEQIRKLME